MATIEQFEAIHAIMGGSCVIASHGGTQSIDDGDVIRGFVKYFCGTQVEVLLATTADVARFRKIIESAMREPCKVVHLGVNNKGTRFVNRKELDDGK